MGELDELTQRLLNEHENGLRQLLSDARTTTEAAIHGQSERMTSALSEAETRQRSEIERIEQRLATAATQAERLSRVGGLRSWMRPLAITAAVMLAVGVLTASGLALTDWLIASRIQQLVTLRDEIQRAENLPRLPQGVEIRTIQGESYLVGVDPDQAFTGTINDGQTPVIGLTRNKED